MRLFAVLIVASVCLLQAKRDTKPKTTNVKKPVKKNAPKSLPIRPVKEKTTKPVIRKKATSARLKTKAAKGLEDPKDALENTEFLRTKSKLESANLYMAKHEPLRVSGDRKIDEMLASPSEAVKAEPYNPERFVKARHELLKRKAENKEPDCCPFKGCNSSNVKTYSSLLLVASLSVCLLF